MTTSNTTATASKRGTANASANGASPDKGKGKGKGKRKATPASIANGLAPRDVMLMLALGKAEKAGRELPLSALSDDGKPAGKATHASKRGLYTRTGASLRPSHVVRNSAALKAVGVTPDNWRDVCNVILADFGLAKLPVQS